MEQNGVSYEDWLAWDGISQTIPIEQSTSIGTAMTILSENGGWLLWEYLSELADHSPNLLAVLGGLSADCQ